MALTKGSFLSLYLYYSFIGGIRISVHFRIVFAKSSPSLCPIHCTFSCALLRLMMSLLLELVHYLNAHYLITLLLLIKTD